ncbi:nucleolar protein dao-5-like [Pollicipes pollicipes]|uniref:nucleolar protein dao-5-like n=1 Tax=Pollicipes pollicipes TaxID=41117 RepID=UPI00188546D4|nr:nucleolar protein dao-5-like [Pollicipes pollicipes]
MAAASIRPSTRDMLLEAMRAAENPRGVSVQAIKRNILRQHPQLQEARLKTSLKKALETALADGTLVRVKGQADAGAALTGSFSIAAAKKSTAKSEKEVAKAKPPDIKLNGKPKKPAATGSTAKLAKTSSKSSLKKSASAPDEEASASAGDELNPSRSLPASPGGVPAPAAGRSALSPRNARAFSSSPTGPAPPAPRRTANKKLPASAAAHKENVGLGGGAARSVAGGVAKPVKKPRPAVAAAPAKTQSTEVSTKPAKRPRAPATKKVTDL